MAKAKEVVKKFKMQAPGGTATPAPPIGPALGANGVNPGQFITKFNAATAALKGKVVGVEVTVYSDRSFDFVIKTPPASVMIKDEIKLEKGSGEPNKNKVGKISRTQLRKIAEEKLKDLNAYDVDAAMRILAGSARSMGVDVVD
jgi:large subunit ribosomal protein L11